MSRVVVGLRYSGGGEGGCFSGEVAWTGHSAVAVAVVPIRHGISLLRF